MNIKIKELLNRCTTKQLVLCLFTVISLLVFAGLTVFAEGKKDALLDQQAAARWSGDGSTAQISCYFTKGNAIDSNKIMEFRYYIDTLLQEASITSEKENARLYIDAYSSSGSITIASEKASLECQAIGTGGDFFFFHPVQLINGSYFSGSDIMDDFVLIDENMAWQLFGSNDIVGMTVVIKNVPHMIAGVYRQEEGRFWEAAGLSENLVFVSDASLSAYGETDGILYYETVMPNPVKSFAYSSIKEKFGFDETKMYVVDNTRRYSLEPLLIVLSDFGIRSMQNAAIQFPYWENYARGYEDVFALLLFFQAIFLLIPALIILMAVITAFRKRTWSIRSIGRFLIDKAGVAKQRIMDTKSKWKHF